MEGKNSFLLYIDIIHTIEKLSDDKAGQLFKHILRYVNDGNPKTDDPIIDIAFEPIKQTLKRDLQNWKDTCEKNRENANIRWNKKSPSASERIRTNTKDADIDKDRDTDKDIDNDINIEFDLFWNLYDKKRGDKSKLQVKWNNLNDETRRKIMDYIPLYKQAQPEKRYRKDPATFLNNRAWEDELISATPETNQEYPNKPDDSYEYKIKEDPKKLQEYWQHLRSLGWKRERVGIYNKWVKV